MSWYQIWFSQVKVAIWTLKYIENIKKKGKKTKQMLQTFNHQWQKKEKKKKKKKKEKKKKKRQKKKEKGKKERKNTKTKEKRKRKKKRKEKGIYKLTFSWLTITAEKLFFVVIGDIIMVF